MMARHTNAATPLHPRGHGARTDPRHHGHGDDAHLRALSIRPSRSASSSTRRIEPMMAAIYICRADPRRDCRGVRAEGDASRGTVRGRARRRSVDRARRHGRAGVRPRDDRDVLPDVRRVRHRGRSATRRRSAGSRSGSPWRADILAIGPLTGASMNPARSLGPGGRERRVRGSGRVLGRPDRRRDRRGAALRQLFLRRAPELPLHGAVRPEEPAPPPAAMPSTAAQAGQSGPTLTR